MLTIKIFINILFLGVVIGNFILFKEGDKKSL